MWREFPVQHLLEGILFALHQRVSAFWFITATIRYFDHTEASEARDWLAGK
jgi:hypothetical protein